MTITLYHDTCRWTIDPEIYFDPKRHDGVTLTDMKKLIKLAFTDPQNRNTVALLICRALFLAKVDEAKDEIRETDRKLNAEPVKSHSLQDSKARSKRIVAELNKVKNRHAAWFKLLSFYDEMSKKYI